MVERAYSVTPVRPSQSASGMAICVSVFQALAICAKVFFSGGGHPCPSDTIFSLLLCLGVLPIIVVTSVGLARTDDLQDTYHFLWLCSVE